MATDIIIRASGAEAADGKPVDAVIAISMFSEAVTESEPARLLVISGQGEKRLREAGLKAVRLVDPQAQEGDLVVAGGVSRRAAVAPLVEHVGVLFSPTAVDEARVWLDETFGHPATVGAGQMGWWILALLGGIVLGFYPIAFLLPKAREAHPMSARRFLLATLLPAAMVPLLITPVYTNFLPVLVADYLMLHLALFGILQLVLLGRWPTLPWRLPVLPVVALVLWGIGVFGLALDRYGASFWPTPERMTIIAALSLGTIPFAIADSCVTGAGRGPLWQRITARVLLLVSLVIAVLLHPRNLTFILIVLPVFVLFLLVHGLMGRWIARHAGGPAAGLGLGLCLAWALGVSFPLFANL
jgi:hypothetical protein